MFNTPNVLSLSRIFCGWMILLLLKYHPFLPFEIPFYGILIVVAILVILAETTDILDGHLARKRKQVTDIGKLLDPMADSINRMMIFLAFVSVDWMSGVMLGIMFTRDIIVSTMRSIAAKNGLIVSARLSGKVKAVCQGIAQGIIIIVQFLVAINLLSKENAVEIGWWTLAITTVVTAISGIDYMWGIIPQIIRAEDTRKL